MPLCIEENVTGCSSISLAHGSSPMSKPQSAQQRSSSLRTENKKMFWRRRWKALPDREQQYGLGTRWTPNQPATEFLPCARSQCPASPRYYTAANYSTTSKNSCCRVCKQCCCAVAVKGETARANAEQEHGGRGGNEGPHRRRLSHYGDRLGGERSRIRKQYCSNSNNNNHQTSNTVQCQLDCCAAAW